MSWSLDGHDQNELLNLKTCCALYLEKLAKTKIHLIVHVTLSVYKHFAYNKGIQA